MLDNQQVRQRVARVESLLETLETLPDARARASAVEAVQGLLELYGEALARTLDCVDRQGGPTLTEALAEDELVAQLLILHGLHPVPVETRVQRALEELAPFLTARGGSAELVEVAEGVARLRLRASGGGCGSSVDGLRLAVEQAIGEAAPDLERIEIEPADEATLRPAATFVPLAEVV